MTKKQAKEQHQKNKIKDNTCPEHSEDKIRTWSLGLTHGQKGVKLTIEEVE